MKLLLSTFLFLLFLDQGFSQKISPIGSGLTLQGTIYDIASDPSTDKTYVVGNFTAIDGIESDNIALIEDGIPTQISDTTKIDGFIFCAEFYEGNLYIGGNFTIGEDKSIQHLAKLENGVWKSMGVELFGGSIRTMKWHKDALYISGDFRHLSGQKNNGVMKFRNGNWSDSGLYSDLNADGLFESGNALYAWGTGFNGSGNYTHTVSIFENNSWTSLPAIENQEESSTSAIVYNGILYTTLGSSLYQFDYDEYKWIHVISIGDNLSDSAILFNHNGELSVYFEAFGFYQLKFGNLELMDFQDSELDFSGEVYAVESKNNNLIIGGNFKHETSDALSLAIVENNELRSFGKASSNTTHLGPFSYAVGNTITRYNEKFVIGGIFDFADKIYSPNIVYWDEEEFIPFDVPLPGGVKQLEVFEGELYAIPHWNTWQTSDPDFPGGLIKFNGDEWVSTNQPLSVSELQIINDRLFITNDERLYNLDDGGPYFLQNGQWHKLPTPNIGETDFFFEEYGNIQAHNNGYLMTFESWPEDKQLIYLPEDSEEWIELASVPYDYDRIRTIDEEIYLFDRDIIYKLDSTSVDTFVYDIETEFPILFQIKDKKFYSSWNGRMFLFEGQNVLSEYATMRIRDIEKIDDDRYLFAMQSSFTPTGLERNFFNNIGIFSMDPLEVNMVSDQEEICQQEYIEFWPETEHASVDYSWEFEGGIPATSTALNPMIKYNNPGVYNASLHSSNPEGDTVSVTTQVFVNDCGQLETRANNYDNHWIMGYEFWTGRGLGGFDYSLQDSIIASRYLSPIDLRKANSIMSDEKGNLQYYTNGTSLYNMNNQAIQGSDCLDDELGEFPYHIFLAHQSLLSLPAVNQEGIYILFDIDPFAPEGEFYAAASNLSMTTIDMNSNNGLGSVTHCNEVLIDDILLNSTMQATKHANGQDWWIIIGKYQSDEYYKILLTENGIESIENASWDRYYGNTFTGQSTFSPSGEYFAQVISDEQSITIWKFDNLTGDLTDRRVYTIIPVDETDSPQACSFSPNSRFLYVSSLTQMRQIDLCNFEEIDAVLLDSWDGAVQFIYPLYFGRQMLNPQQQIVVAPYGNSHYSFGLIEKPNKKGRDCDFKQHVLDIHEFTRNSADVLPNFPHFRKYPSFEGDCFTSQTNTLDETNRFFVYPNPAQSDLAIRFSESATGELYDVNGRKIFSFSNTNYLDIHSIPSGIYFIKTDKGNQQFVKQE